MLVEAIGPAKSIVVDQWGKGHGVAVVHGESSRGFCTLDIDLEEDVLRLREILGDEALATWIVKTTRGWHVHYFHDGDINKAAIPDLFGLKVELLGKASPVAMPPTVLGPGRTYRSLQDPRETDIRRLPKAVVDEAHRRQSGPRVVSPPGGGRCSGLTARDIHNGAGRLVEGNRHNGMLVILGRVRDLECVSPQMLDAIAVAVNRDCFERPLPNDEVRRIVKWINTRGAERFDIPRRRISELDAKVLAKLRDAPGGAKVVPVAAAAYDCSERTVQRAITGSKNPKR